MEVDLTATPSQILIRPGVQILPDSIFPGWCTAAFTFSGETRISTAGHCSLYVGDRVFGVVAPTLVLDFGTTIDRLCCGVGNDWALIAIDPLFWTFTDADVAFWGGPCGGEAATAPAGAIVKHVGHGLGVGAGGTPRAGTLNSLTATTARYTSLTQGGDSGSPVMVQTGPVTCLDQSLAIHTHTSLPCDAGFCLKHGTRIQLVPGTADNGNRLPV